MSRAWKKAKDGRITLPSDRSAEVARRFEEQDATVVIPAPLLMLLLDEVRRGGASEEPPRYEVIDLDPDELIVVDEMFDEAFREDVAV